MIKIFLILINVIAVIILLSCSEDNHVLKGSTHHSVYFGYQSKQVTANSRAVASFIKCIISENDSVIIDTIISIENFNGVQLSKPLLLEEGDYSLESFIILGEDSTPMYITPREDAALSYLVDNPVPVSFTVTADSIQTLVPQVLAANDSNIFELGYLNWKFDIVHTLNFLISVFVYDTAYENYVQTSASFELQSSELDTPMTFDLFPQINSLLLIDSLSDYSVTISKNSYQNSTYNFSLNDINSYSTEPLQVYLQPSGVVNNDSDGDGVVDSLDNCVNTPNPDQADSDGDGVGDVCDTVETAPDSDGDGVVDSIDNCVNTPNADQADSDGDGVGDVCDTVETAPDSDGDGVVDTIDNCVNTPNADQTDSDGDGIGDACDTLSNVTPDLLNDPNTFASISTSSSSGDTIIGEEGYIIDYLPNTGYGRYGTGQNGGSGVIEAIYAFSAIMNIDSVRILAEATGSDSTEISLIFANSSSTQFEVFNFGGASQSPVYVDTVFTEGWENVIDMKLTTKGSGSNSMESAGGIIYNFKVYGQ